MSTIVVRRLAQAVPLLLIISALAFALIHAAPGGPLAIYLENPNVRPEDIARLRHALGLDRSLPAQYASWLVSFMRGDWGYSYADGRPVTMRILERIPATLELSGASLLVALLAAIPIGVIAAVRQGSIFDRVSTSVSLAGISLPVFWFGLVLQLVFAVWLHWLPSSGRASFVGRGFLDELRHLALPATVLAAAHAATWSRFMRASMAEVLRQRFLVAVTSRGVPRSVVLLRHALRNALLPLVTVLLLDAALVVSGAVVTESVFAWPGLGALFTEALGRRDYAVLMGFLMLTSAAVVMLNFVADVSYRLIDPRVRR